MVILRNTLLGVLVVVALGVAAVYGASFLWAPAGEAQTPAGYARNTASLLPAADGTRLAIDVWLPADLQSGQRVHTVLEGTRYWRATGLTRLGRMAAMLGVPLPGVTPPDYARYFNAKGYAYAIVDVRGTGASFGVHTTEYSLEEAADYAAVLDWLVARDWSSGSVVSIGVSYGGTSAELMATNGHPALKAAAPLFADFDTQFHLATPGGVYQPAFIETWSAMVSAMDTNDICGLIAANSGTADDDVDCTGPELLVKGPKPVDGPDGDALLAAAVAEHDSPNVADMVRNLHYRDDEWGESGVRSADNQVYARKAEIEAAGTPLYVMTGWFDAATSDGALARFASFSNPQSVWIGPFDHGGGNDVDPYKPSDAAPVWSGREQLDRVEAFFRARLSGEPLTGQTLNYFVMGAGSWKTTRQWPPVHISPRTLFLAADNTLTAAPPPAVAGTDVYTVDYEVGTAQTSRWITQMGGSDVVYDQRAAMGNRSLTFTSEPFAVDTELTGTVALDLWLASTRDDGALHAYLEGVAPDGTVVYLTEGVLRLMHRSVTDEPPYPTFGPAHSFLRRDAGLMPAGEPARVQLGLYATSARIPQGHRVRIALTGADNASFERLPHDGPPPVWTVYRDIDRPSSVTLPVAPW